MLYIPKDGFISLESSMFKEYSHFDDGSKCYRLAPLGTNLDLITAESQIAFACRIMILKKYEKSLLYRIDYFSKYASGHQTGNMIN